MAAVCEAAITMKGKKEKEGYTNWDTFRLVWQDLSNAFVGSDPLQRGVPLRTRKQGGTSAHLVFSQSALTRGVSLYFSFPPTMERRRSESTFPSITMQEACSFKRQLISHFLRPFLRALLLQGSATRPRPGCVNAAGKLKQKW